MKRIIFNRNENSFNASPKVLRSLSNFNKRHISEYIEDYHNSELTSALSNLFKLPREQIIVTQGSEGFLRTVFDTLKPSDVLLTHALHYSYYEKYLRFRGIKKYTFNILKEKDTFTFDIGDCLKKIAFHKPRVVLITSPNNPTGNSIGKNDLERVIKAVQKNSLVILDEAYFGFNPSYKSNYFVNLVKKYPNFTILRTFSKYYSMAGLRIGFALCGKNVSTLLRYKEPYLGNSRLLEQAAIAALNSQAYYKKIANKIIQSRERFITQINKTKNFTAYKSDANFVIVQVNKHLSVKVGLYLDKLPFAISKFVDKDLMRVTIEPKKYTAKFLSALIAFDKQN